MVDLLQMYERHGLDLKPGELPDHLPVFLEYLSRLPAPDARSLLGETGEILRALAAQLAKRGSHYGFVVGALLPLAGIEPIDVPADAPAAPADDVAAERPSAADYRALDAAYLPRVAVHADGPHLERDRIGRVPAAAVSARAQALRGQHERHIGKGVGAARRQRRRDR